MNSGKEIKMGYFAIGIDHSKYFVNIGTLLRSANIFGASFVFTTGRRYEQQHSDTLNSWKSIPLYHYQTIDELKIPHSCKVVGVELTPESKPIETYKHFERSIYILGAEDHGLTKDILNICHDVIEIPGNYCLNVATAGSIVMYDRILKERIK